MTHKICQILIFRVVIEVFCALEKVPRGLVLARSNLKWGWAIFFAPFFTWVFASKSTLAFRLVLVFDIIDAYKVKLLNEGKRAVLACVIETQYMRWTAWIYQRDTNFYNVNDKAHSASITVGRILMQRIWSLFTCSLCKELNGPILSFKFKPPIYLKSPYATNS